MHTRFFYTYKNKKSRRAASPLLIVVVVQIGVRLGLAVLVKYTPRRIGHLPSVFSILEHAVQAKGTGKALTFRSWG